MRYKQLGRTGTLVSELCLGTMTFGGQGVYRVIGTLGAKEVEGLIDIVRRTTEAEVTCVVKEEADGSVRVSLRSLGDVDVRAIAADNGGGGHRYAAGFESTLDIPSVVANIRGAL